MGAITKVWAKRMVMMVLASGTLLLAVYWGLLYYLSFVMKDAEYFEEEIAAFEASDRADPPLPGRILFVGSSSIRLWKSLERDMAPYPVLNRGFGGSMIHHSVYYADRIILKHQPAAIVYYGGSNDIGNLVAPRSPRQVAKDWEQLVALVRQKFPDIPIFYISIKPTQLRARMWGKMVEANDLIREQVASDPNMHFIDVATPMLDDANRPNGDYFIWDGLHMNEQGYALWTKIVRRALVVPLGTSRLTDSAQ